MGQRTQILVVRENASGEKKCKFYHHQWGYGRSMYLALIDCYINDYNKETFVSDYNFLDNKNFGCFDHKLYDETPLSYNEINKLIEKFSFAKKTKIWDELKHYKLCYVEELNKNIIINEGLLEALNNVDVKNLKTIQEVFKYGDNNNGGLVIYIKENKEAKYKGADFTIGFLLGEEDSYTYHDNKRIQTDIPFSHWLTPEQYGALNGGSCYSDSDFIKIFTDFCKYFEIKYLQN